MGVESSIYTPTVSVVMSMYNAARYLKEAVESILSQSYQNFEFLIFDDGSSDESRAIIESYRERDTRVRLFVRENGGLTKRLNEGIGLARGEFLARMDADDIAGHKRLETQIDYLRSHPDVDCVGSGYLVIDEMGRIIGQNILLEEDDEKIQKKLLEGYCPICHPTAMIRINALRNVGGYDEAMVVSQDYDLWLRLGEIGKLANIRSALLNYREHAGAISNAAGQYRQLEFAKEACRRAWVRREVTGKFLAGPWRPTNRKELYQHILKSSRFAFSRGDSKTAAYYAIRGLQVSPSRRECWRLLWNLGVCGIKRHLKGLASEKFRCPW